MYICTPNSGKSSKKAEKSQRKKYFNFFWKKIWKRGIKVFIFAAALIGTIKRDDKEIRIYYLINFYFGKAVKSFNFAIPNLRESKQGLKRGLKKFFERLR